MRQLGRVGAEREATLPREFYMGAGALTPEHLHSLSFQILQIARLQPRRVLEVGIGNGFVSTYLRQMGIEVVTADINPALAPDVCAPLHELPERLAGQRFDVVSCCEVLEHMPFEQFDGHVCTLARLGTHAFISLPGHWVWAGLAGRLVTGWRTDLETIVEANKKSYAGLQDMVGRQMAHLKERIGEMQAVAKVMTVIGPKDSVRHLDDLALASVEMALADVRELADAAAQSQREAFDLVHRRVSANIDEVQRLLRK